jgi:mono/diheme cytochrome c family protein
MWIAPRHSTLAALLLATALSLAVVLGRLTPHWAQSPRRAPEPGGPPPAKGAGVDSYYDYGPNRLSKTWHEKDAKGKPARPHELLGRDTWFHWTWGNQKVIRRATVLAGNLPVPVSIDLFRLLDSRNRQTRFRDLGLINEPNCGRNPNDPSDTTDYDEKIWKDYKLYIDKFRGDPLGYYPVSEDVRKGNAQSYPEAKDRAAGYYPLKYPNNGKVADTRHYGRPTGIIGLRLFHNPAFNDEAKKRWDVNEYFKNPGKMEPPFLVGFTCGFCHVAFDATNPPRDPENPRWDNLAGNIGNQYFREGELMLGKGRSAFGDKHPDPSAPNDPYRTRGLTDEDFLYHYAVTQQPGTSETSRISYDFINNPNTINPIFGFKYRPKHTETTQWGKRRKGVYRILKDGADALGLKWALMRVPINIGCEGEYWIDHLFLPASGKEQRPFRIPEVVAAFDEKERQEVFENLGIGVAELAKQQRRDLGIGSPENGSTELARKQLRELLESVPGLKSRYRSPYGKEAFGQDWQEAWRRVDSLTAYLVSYEPARLKDAATRATNPDDVEAAKKSLPDDKDVKRGVEVFAQQCARCHNSKPLKDPKKPPTDPRFYQDENFLADDERYPVTYPGLGTNMARALATNAVDHDVWAEFSSREYKALPSVAPLSPLRLRVPVFPPNAPLPAFFRAPIPVEFDPPAGGRGYYRTPSLISMWATAPYLHNNSVGDYYVVLERDKDRKPIKKGWFPNDGRRIGKKLPDGTWVDYEIDVSVEGRLKMFEDGVRKLLNPAKRHGWVKRTSAPSALVPDQAAFIQQLIGSIAQNVLRDQVRAVLKEHNLVPAHIDSVLQVIDASLQRTVKEVLKDVEVSRRFALAALHLRARDHADRLFDLLFDDVSSSPELKLLLSKPALKNLPLRLATLKLTLRREFLARLDRLDDAVAAGAMWKVPAGTPVNLYANLPVGRLPHALLAHVRLRDDPRALAQALLSMSACPDLVEDSGHIYGKDLPDADKEALIAFLKTL